VNPDAASAGVASASDDAVSPDSTVTPGVAVPPGVAPPVVKPLYEGPLWRFLIAPKWLLWHLTAVAGVWGMLWLGDWQYHRAVGGNGLSWAYTFEWPMFACFGAVFWARTIRDEFRIRRAGLDPNLEQAGVEVGIQLPAGLGIEQAGQYVRGALGAAPGTAAWTGAAGSEPVLASAWRADIARARAERASDPEVAEYNIYLARLNAKDEVKELARVKDPHKAKGPQVAGGQPRPVSEHGPAINK
jgi:hypothetical protein